MIKAVKLRKVYNTGDHSLNALDGVSFDIEDGSFVAIVGRSGSGKSTLLHILGTLDFPNKGKVFVNDVDITNMSPREQANYRNRQLGFVFQSFYLEPSYTVCKNIEIPLVIGNQPKISRRDIVLDNLKLVGLEHKIDMLVNNLSGGEKQRVAIARALVNKPSIILADEPCGNLDTTNAQNIISILRSLANNGITVILVTHNLEDARSADRIITLEDGKIINDEKVV